jgi:sigma-B regulation protein RsbU (phosphoserine phosphatase)
MEFSNAGHPPPRVRKAGGDAVVPLHAVPGLPLGIDAGEEYGNHAAVLSPGDTLVLYTDGITEARDPTNQLFGSARFDDALSRCEGTAEETVAAALSAVDQFTDSAPPTDDRTLLVAKVK